MSENEKTPRGEEFVVHILANLLIFYALELRKQKALTTYYKSFIKGKADGELFGDITELFHHFHESRD